MKLLIIFLCINLSISSLMSQVKVKVFYSEINGSKICANPVKEFICDSLFDSNAAYIAKLYPNIKFQTIKGIGGAFNEIGGEALMSLNEEQRNYVMKNMFDISEGAGFSFCRTAIGSSDFYFSPFSYSRTPNDFKLENFDFGREEKSVIPYIRLGLKHNPDLAMFASPWSPPGWMKYSGHMDKGKINQEQNMLKDEDEIYEAYSLYFEKYIKGYSDYGIDIDRVLIQNEQDYNTNYPSCYMPVWQMVKFVQEYLSPRFIRNRINTEIWAGTFRSAGELSVIDFINSKKNLRGFDGVGVQYIKPEYIDAIRQLNSSVKIMHTESKCFHGENSIEQAYGRLEEIASYINYGCDNFCYWNMILNETGKSGWGWKQNSLITINRQNKDITYNPDYAVMYLLSKFIRPGSTRIASYTTEPSISVCYDGKINLIMINRKNVKQNIKCFVENDKYNVVLPAKSICAIVIELL